MSDVGAPAAQSVRAEVIVDFARSALFDRTFEEGMELVDEAAFYLDGAGRHDVRGLARREALAFAAHSMRLTTRLMQTASWLLTQRAIGSGDMAPETACGASYRLRGEEERTDPGDAMPVTLRQLLERSERLFERVRHLDRRVYVEWDVLTPFDQPVLAQLERLRDAFEIS
ncbi:MAG: DUF1465 family protein [Caulobacteraceae bacterium]